MPKCMESGMEVSLVHNLQEPVFILLGAKNFQLSKFIKGKNNTKQTRT